MQFLKWMSYLRHDSHQHGDAFSMVMRLVVPNPFAALEMTLMLPS
jgi:hypothetical protein